MWAELGSAIFVSYVPRKMEQIIFKGNLCLVTRFMTTEAYSLPGHCPIFFALSSCKQILLYSNIPIIINCITCFGTVNGTVEVRCVT